MSLCYDQLVQFDPFEVDAVIPNLAHSWEFPDDTTLVFHLNEATFHDGTPFTSEDVAATMERIARPPEGVVSVAQGSFSMLERVSTPDDRTAIFHLSRPSASVVPMSAVNTIAMYAAHDINNDAFDHREQINGTGPFTLERYDRGSLMAFARNPNYFEAGDLPYVDGVEFHYIPEEVTKFASFRSGDLDFYPAVATDAQTVEDTMPEATLLSAAGTSWFRTVVATWKEPWTDPRTWHAVGLAINKQDANQAISNGRGFDGGPVSPGSRWALSEEDLLQVPGYKGVGDGRESDMDARRTEARRLLDAAGVAEGTSVQVMGNDSPTNFEPWAIVFIDGLQHVGLVPELTLHERATYDERLFAGDYGDMAAASSSALIPDPTPTFADNIIEGAPRNYSALVIPEVEELFVQQEQTLDPEERFNLARQMQLAYLDVFPAEIATFSEVRKALHNYVHGFGELYGSFFVSRKMQWLWLDR